MKFYPGLDQPQLLPGQFSGKYLSIIDPDRRLEFGVFCMNMRQMMMLVVGLDTYG
uniref:Uncharacterized protein n=1 Tax=Candidatus Kentrum sp. SD TaxID=2126332 RepID=A0A450Z844_9GAMM|nr:MAG: hypothetical protein BECKSD772F_GA0070984_13192 [Candidatus Kentron sp. SD]VFK49973.1 MAG: hypothetical protein BECKSD772E_GA0070983_13032 [Candidatus Kentron sp. SD]